VDQVQKECEKQNIKTVVFCGDMFKSRTKLDVEVFTETWNAFKRLSDSVNDLYILCGNHDQVTKYGDYNCLDPFRSIATVITSTVDLHLHSVKCTFIPHIADEQVLQDTIDNLEPRRVVFMHQTAKEAIPGADDNPSKPSFSVRDVLAANVDLVVSGDIHKRQTLADGRWHYVGSPLQLTFGERHDRKCFSVIDMESLTIEDVPTVGPRFVKFEAPAKGEDPLTELPADINRVNIDKDFYKLVYAERWSASASALKQMYPRMLLEKIRDADVDLSDVKIDMIGDDIELLQAYIDRADTYGMCASRLLQEGLEELRGGSE